MQSATKRIRTRYWRPGDDFLKIIVESIAAECKDGDIVVLSEKAISVATGCVVDENEARPGNFAKVLAGIWMKLVWGHILGRLCHLNKRTISRLRRYPRPLGDAHKATVMKYAGFWQALLHYSEGGIDVTNLPYSLASLPLRNSEEVAERARELIAKACEKEVSVLVADTDKTYSRKGTHLTPRPNAIRGIRTLGILAFIIGRALRWTAQATPIALCGRQLSVAEALAVADAADRARGYGAGRTVWDMSKRFGVDFTEVTWEMLDRVQHYPIVLVRKTQ